VQIALDAMGGDCGSQELIAGALLAVEQTDLNVILVGDEKRIQSDLDSLAPSRALLSRVDIVHASQVVEMHDNPVEAIRKKKDSSIMVAFDLVKEGKASGAVSAGNSGATLAAGMRKLGRLKGISRPGLASSFPTLKSPVVLMDIGANVDCKPIHLFQFGIMASAYARIHNTPSPRVGILSNGEETGKGNSLVKETYLMMRDSSLDFVGNVEGRDVYQGDVDVVVCDGFVGNVCLKISEGLADAAMRMLRDEIMKSTLAKIGYLLARPAFKAFKKRVDYAEYGGAPLLGINGIGVVSHGKSSFHAIKNAIVQAADMERKHVNSMILESLELEDSRNS